MIHTMPDDTFDIILKIHVRAPFRLIRQAAPYFRLKVYYNESFFYHPYAHAHPAV
jgi:3-oxoacyl-[acyl-carrier protein] reductase